MEFYILNAEGITIATTCDYAIAKIIKDHVYKGMIFTADEINATNTNTEEKVSGITRVNPTENNRVSGITRVKKD